MHNQRLKFQEEDHSYTLDGIPIPSVTTILSNVGLYPDFQFVDEWYAERGKRVHKACHFLDKGTLDREKLEAQDKGGLILPYVESYEKFKEVFEIQVNESEIQLFDETYWFAGTADKVIRIRWEGQFRDAVVDLKCGGPEFGYQYQLAGYSFAMGDHYSKLRIGVYLQKDGSLSKIIEYDKPGDFDEFKAACVVYHAKQRKEK